MEPGEPPTSKGGQTAGSWRRALHDGALATVIDASAAAEDPPPSGYSPDFQVVFPYHGLVGFRVGRRVEVFDANRTLFVTGGEEFADSHPVRGLGHASLILTPAAGVLEELCGGAAPRDHAAFRAVTRMASPRTRFLAQALRRTLPADPGSLQSEELIVAALREALAPGEAPADKAAPQVVERAKQVLHAFGFERLTLERIARQVGVTPTYLTQAFTRAEGVPLYRYQLNLRLNQALVEAPHSDDLTSLALDLGFSSHGHFSTAFKAAFGVSPSRYRADPRCRAQAA